MNQPRALTLLRITVLARGVRLRIDESVGDAAVVEGVGEAAGQDIVEDGAWSARELRPDDLHACGYPGGGVLLRGDVLEPEPCGILVDDGSHAIIVEDHF